MSSARMRAENGRLELEGEIVRRNVPDLFRRFSRFRRRELSSIDLTGVTKIDHSGVAFLDHVRDTSKRASRVTPEYEGAPPEVRDLIELFGSTTPETGTRTARHEGALERLGGGILHAIRSLGAYIRLAADVTFWTLAVPFDRKSRRRGSIAEQCDRIGVRAIPIVAFLSLIIGVIVVLQSAAQLRQFGATIYVVDLLAISITRETGPLFTAIIIGGRSGSSIAAQIATMRVTEELDALTVMALDPIRYVIVPMMAGMLLTIPALTGLSMLVGIGGGLLVAALSLDLTVETFLNRTVEIIGGLDLFIGIAKSFFFGAAIVCTGSFFGLTSRGGSEGVGRSTTSSVVASIFLVIVLNALFSLLYLV